MVNTICDLLDEIVPKQGSYRDQIIYVTDRPGTIAAMRLMHQKSAMSWAGNRRKPLNREFEKLLVGI